MSRISFEVKGMNVPIGVEVPKEQVHTGLKEKVKSILKRQTDQHSIEIDPSKLRNVKISVDGKKQTQKIRIAFKDATEKKQFTQSLLGKDSVTDIENEIKKKLNSKRKESGNIETRDNKMEMNTQKNMNRIRNIKGNSSLNEEEKTDLIKKVFPYLTKEKGEKLAKEILSEDNNVIVYQKLTEIEKEKVRFIEEIGNLFIDKDLDKTQNLLILRNTLSKYSVDPKAISPVKLTDKEAKAFHKEASDQIKKGDRYEYSVFKIEDIENNLREERLTEKAIDSMYETRAKLDYDTLEKLLSANE